MSGVRMLPFQKIDENSFKSNNTIMMALQMSFLVF